MSIARCGFGDLHVPLLALPDSTRFACATPPHDMAHAPFSISLNGVDFTPTKLTYRFYPQRVAQETRLTAHTHLPLHTEYPDVYPHQAQQNLTVHSSPPPLLARFSFSLSKGKRALPAGLTAAPTCPTCAIGMATLYPLHG